MADGRTPAACYAATREAMAFTVAAMIEDGRTPPPAALEGQRSEQVNVRLTPEEKLEIEAAAQQRGFRGVADFFRTAAMAMARQQTPAAPAKAPPAAVSTGRERLVVQEVADTERRFGRFHNLVMAGASDDDWRLMGQDRFLKDAVLYRRSWHKPRPRWDHDHCEFCFAKFSEDIPDTLSAGYTTSDDYHWVCDQCFADFYERFNWTVGSDR